MGSSCAATTTAAGPHRSRGERRRTRPPRTRSVRPPGGTVILEYPRLLQQVQRAPQIVKVAQVHLGALYLRERGQFFIYLDALDKRVLVGLISEVLLGLFGESVLEELLRGLGVLGAVEDSGPRSEDERAGVAILEVVVAHRYVLALFLDHLEEVVVVDESDVHFAGGHPFDGG